MIRVIAIILQVAAVAGGAFIGLSLRGGAPSTEHADASHEAEQHATPAGDERHEATSHAEEKAKSKPKEKTKKTKSGGHGGGHGEADSADASTYMKFSRQFIVPTVTRDNANALVILDINLELNPSAVENAYAREPKVRDAILMALLELSNEGVFRGGLTDVDTTNAVRTRVAAAAASVLGEDVAGVLILSIARNII